MARVHFRITFGIMGPRRCFVVHESQAREFTRSDIHKVALQEFTMAFSLSNNCDQTRYCNISLRRLPPVYSLALRLRNSKAPVWTHQSIGYLKMDISHWDAAIHYGVQLAQYCDQTRSCNATLWMSPLCTPLP